MTWLLLATPLAGMLMLVAALWVGHRLFPPKRISPPQVEPDTVDYQALVQKTALILGKGVVAILRDSLDKLTPVRAPVAQDLSSEFPQFAKPTTMNFEGTLEFDRGSIANRSPESDERTKLARRTIGPRSPA
jgi:hypothetical protein